MSNSVYYVDSYDAHGITLRQFMFSFIKVRVPRSSIASVSTALGVHTVTTNSGHSYRINEGVRPKQRSITTAALSNESA